MVERSLPPVEPIITAAEFEKVQAIMRSRSPQLRAPRFVSGPTLLGGVAFCAATAAYCRRHSSATAIRRRTPHPEVRINTRKVLEASALSTIMCSCQQTETSSRLGLGSTTFSTMRRRVSTRRPENVDPRRQNLRLGWSLTRRPASPRPSWIFWKSISLTSWTRYSTQSVELMKGGVA